MRRSTSISVWLVLLVLLFLTCYTSMCEARSMWGSRRKRDHDAEEDQGMRHPAAPDAAPLFETKKQPKIPRGSSFDTVANKAAEAGLAIEQMVNMYIQMMEQMLQSDDFATLVNPKSIKTMMQQFPGFSESPELAAMFDSPEFKNPELLKATVQQGLTMIKTSAPELINMLSDPAKITEVLEQLPDEVKSMLEGVMSGDFSALKEIVSSLPGLDEKQRTLLTNLMEGNADSITQQLSDVLGDASQVEAARQQFVENPEMAEALGIPADVLSDPRLWAEMMAEGMEALGEDADEDADDEALAELFDNLAEDEEPVIQTKRKLFSRA